MIQKLIFYCSILTVSSVCLGQELLETHYSVRAMGMGNAYTSVVSDGDALWYNPANLCLVEGYNWTFMDMRAAANGLKASQDIAAIQGATTLSDYSNLFGTDITLDVGGKTAAFVPCMGFTGYGNGYININMKNPVFPELEATYQADYGVKAGGGFMLGPGLHMGIAFSRIVRSGGTVPFGPGYLVSPDSGSATSQFQNMGAGFGTDLGLTWQIPAAVSPILSFAWKNVGYTGFSHIGGASAPKVQRDEMVFGVAFDLDTTFVRVLPSLDFKYVNRSDVQLGKKLHLGLEIDLPLVALRAGFNQGYWTMGAGLDLFFIRFDVATWGVEKGVYPGQDEDRRFAATLTFELGFDASFNFSGFNTTGNRRRLKLRR